MELTLLPNGICKVVERVGENSKLKEQTLIGVYNIVLNRLKLELVKNNKEIVKVYWEFIVEGLMKNLIIVEKEC